MEIFVIHKGEQSGPHRIFELRDMIAAGKFEITDSGWYKGLESWKPLSEIDALRDAIPEGEEDRAPEPEAAPETPDEPAEAAERGILPPAIPVAGDVPQQQSVLTATDDPEVLGKRMWVRLGARMVDISPIAFLVLGPLLEEMISMLRDEGSQGATLLVAGVTLAWFFLDAAFVTTFGTTPGKWLAGLHIVDSEGARPKPGRSLARSMLVYAFGWGFGLPLLTLLSWVCTIVRVRQVGNAVWDGQLKTRVLGRRVSKFRLALMVVIPFVIFQTAISLNQEQVDVYLKLVQALQESGAQSE